MNGAVLNMKKYLFSLIEQKCGPLKVIIKLWQSLAK